jgi:hypothetical protein
MISKAALQLADAVKTMNEAIGKFQTGGKESPDKSSI